MDKKRFLLNKRIRYMVMLAVVFMILLVLFDIVVYAVTRTALYEDCDKQISEAEEHVLSNPDNALENLLKGNQIVYYDDGSNYVISYKIFVLVRDTKGNILNSEYLSSFDYMLNMDFATKDAGSFITKTVERNGEKVSYRTYMFALTSESGEVYYIQFATDSSDIERSLEILRNVLFFATLAALVVVFLAGWFLSKSLVSGVVDAWERQDEFISFASHELRSPLAVVHSSLELLLEKPGAKIIERGDLILNSLTETNRLRKMTNSLLEMVKLQSAEMILHLETIDVKKMIEEFIEPFIFQAQATGKTINYEVQEKLLIRADKALITEMLVVFLENALKYTEPNDSITVSAEERKSEIIFSVADTGVGISEEGLEKVFTRFYREERIQSKADGSGLGLYIAGLIAQAHDGKVSARANSPKGTIFTVTMKKTR